MSDSIDTNKVVVLTGGTSGIGRIAAVELASEGITVAVIGRNEHRGRSLQEEATSLAGDIDFYQADLSSQATVRTLAADLCDDYSRIDVLVHNAGLSANSRTETEDGLELTFAVNHLAPYLLTHELLDRLRESSPARIVVTASDIHRRATFDFDDLQFTNDYDGLQAYSHSKLANIAFTRELASRLSDTEVTANCFHPGFVPSTNLFRDAPFWTRFLIRGAAIIPGVGTTQQEGARRLLRLATDSTFAEQSGVYLTGNGIETPSAEASKREHAESLWEISAELVGVDSDWP